MTELVWYGNHIRPKPGTGCLLCAAQPLTPFVDHCHSHGWVRGALCNRCNILMGFIDRRETPKKIPPPLSLAALVEYASRCPECESFTVEDLGPAVSSRLDWLKRQPPDRAMKKLNARLPDDVHAKLAALAEAERRSLNSMIIVLIEGATERDSPAT